jgi:hypothetical protein
MLESLARHLTGRILIVLDNCEHLRADTARLVYDLRPLAPGLRFVAATVGHLPLVHLLSGERALLALRILAVFACPAPEEHAEVRTHALRPLIVDGRKILSDRVKEQLSELLPDLVQDAGAADLPDTHRG